MHPVCSVGATGYLAGFELLLAGRRSDVLQRVDVGSRAGSGPKVRVSARRLVAVSNESGIGRGARPGLG